MKKIVLVGQPPKPGGEKYLTRKEVAADFGVDVRTIDNWRDKYEMPHYCMGGQVRFVELEVDAWARTMRRGKPVPSTREKAEIHDHGPRTTGGEAEILKS